MRERARERETERERERTLARSRKARGGGGGGTLARQSDGLDRVVWWGPETDRTDRQTDKDTERDRDKALVGYKHREVVLFFVVFAVVVSIQLPSWIISTQLFSSCERHQSLQIQEVKYSCYSVSF